jgi:hypothetical protein
MKLIYTACMKRKVCTEYVLKNINGKSLLVTSRMDGKKLTGVQWFGVPTQLQ